MADKLWTKYKKENDVKDVPYERPIVQFVDALVEYAQHNGSFKTVRTEKDWDTLIYIMKGFFALFPKTAEEFKKQIEDMRARQLRAHAIAKDDRGNSIQHQLKIPKPLYQMIKIIFPEQKWDKKFVLKFAQRFPQFKVTHDKL